MKAYKVFTHTLRPPFRGGYSTWDGTLPFRLPEVNETDKNCDAGWYACRTVDDILRMLEFWPERRPSRIFEVSTDAPVIETDNKLRSSTWTIERELPEAEIWDAVCRLSEKSFGEHAGVMVDEQKAWHHALTRPYRDPEAIEAGLRKALDARGLSDWKIRRCDTANAAKSEAWNARPASESACAAWVAGSRWNGRGPWGEWDIWDVKDALAIKFAGLMGWGGTNPDKLTIGLRDAYAAGLAIAIPTGDKEICWAIED